MSQSPKLIEILFMPVSETSYHPEHTQAVFFGVFTMTSAIIYTPLPA